MTSEPADKSFAPPLRRPDTAELISLAKENCIQISTGEAEELQVIVDQFLGVVEGLIEIAPKHALRASPPPRWEGRRPTSGEDPFNAFVRFCDVEGTRQGQLSGRLIGVKDNIDIGGIPTTNASSMVAHFATSDATVTERLLEAGGRIVGKLNLDNFSSGSTGETSAFGPAQNPVNPAHSAGGSSGGSGSAVSSGAVDLALGVDQAGSARIPASYCGVVALKATHGTVPTFGVTHLDHTLDAVCPMARSASEAELAYDSIAGPDWRDAIWLPERETEGRSVRETSLSEKPSDVKGLRFGVVTEGIDEAICSSDVLSAFRKSTEALSASGARVETVSIPLWSFGYPIARPLLCHLIQAIVSSEGEGYGHFGLIDAAKMHAFARTRRRSGDLFPPNFKSWIITGHYLHQRYLNASYALAQNLRLALREDIKTALRTFDCLLTPTTPSTAPPLRTETLTASDLVKQSDPLECLNTTAANLSGHPALAVPNGQDRAGLPTSIQLVGRYFDERLLFRIARHLEEVSDGLPPHLTPERVAKARADTVRSVEARHPPNTGESAMTIQPEA